MGGRGCVCSVYGCNNYKLQKDRKSFYRFPKNRQTCAQWVVKSGRKHLDEIFRKEGPDRLNANYVVCSDHFSEKEFRNKNLLSQGLWPEAIPTLLLPNSKLTMECHTAKKHLKNCEEDSSDFQDAVEDKKCATEDTTINQCDYRIKYRKARKLVSKYKKFTAGLSAKKDLDDSSAENSCSMEEEEDEVLTPPVAVFVESSKMKKDDVAEQYEDPLIICNEDFSVVTVKEKDVSSPSGSSSKEKSKRKRSRNFDESDKLLVLDLAVGELEIISCKQTDQVSNEKRRNAWLRICNKYNASSPLTGPRSAEQLKALYEAMGKNARKEKRELVGRQKLGGRGPKLSETTLQVLQMLEGIKPVQNSEPENARDRRSADCLGNGEDGTPTPNHEIKEAEKTVTEMLNSRKSSPVQELQMHTEPLPLPSLQTSLNIPSSAPIPSPTQCSKSPEKIQVSLEPRPTLKTYSRPFSSRKESASSSYIPVHKPNRIRTPILQSFVQRRHMSNHNRLFDLKCRKEEQIIKNLEKEYEERSKRCQLLDIELEIKKKELTSKVQELEMMSK